MPTPNTGAVNDLMIGTMFFNYGKYGWSEKYVLATTPPTSNPVPTYSQAKAIMQTGCDYRSWLLGAGCSLVYARISLASVRRDSVPCIAKPEDPSLIDSETDVEIIQEPNDCFLFRCDDGAGRFNVRPLRGLRDSWIADAKTIGNLWTPLPTPATPLVAVPLPPALYTRQNVLDNFLVWMMNNTVLSKKTNPAPLTFQTYPINSLTYRGVSTRNTGRPFGLRRGRAATRV